MRITLASVFVRDQDAALRFYTETLGFVKKHDVPAGAFKWLTVVAPEDPDGTELLLEPNDNPVARAFQQGIFDQGIPAASFGVTDIRAEWENLQARGVAFTMPPTAVANVTVAVFHDTCGNLIQIVQHDRDVASGQEMGAERPESRSSGTRPSASIATQAHGSE